MSCFYWIELIAFASMKNGLNNEIWWWHAQIERAVASL